MLLLLPVMLLLLALQVGLRYYDDFMQRMPRAEVAEVERLVYEAVADTLQVGTRSPTQLSGAVCDDACWRVPRLAA
jgi:hypothetical protein